MYAEFGNGMQCTAMHCTASLIDQANKFLRTCIPTPCIAFALPCSRNQTDRLRSSLYSKIPSTWWDREARQISSLHARLRESKKDTSGAKRIGGDPTTNQSSMDHASGDRGLKYCGESRESTQCPVRSIRKWNARDAQQIARDQLG